MGVIDKITLHIRLCWACICSRDRTTSSCSEHWNKQTKLRFDFKDYRGWEEYKTLIEKGEKPWVSMGRASSIMGREKSSSSGFGRRDFFQCRASLFIVTVIWIFHLSFLILNFRLLASTVFPRLRNFSQNYQFATSTLQLIAMDWYPFWFKWTTRAVQYNKGGEVELKI